MEIQAAAVSCTDPDNVQEFFWTKLKQDMPLAISIEENNIQPPAPSPSVRIQLQSDSTKLEGCHLPVYWYRRPYLFLYLIDRSNNEPITKQEKKQMKGWASDVQTKQEWLVIQFVAAETRRSMIPFYDKSKLDLPKDRYFQVQKKKEQTEDWNEAVRRICECLSASFQRQIKDYKIEVKNHLNRQLVPGWNFCNYFVVTEGLAFTMAQCGCLDAALGYYQMAKEVYTSLSDDKRIDPFCHWKDTVLIISGKVQEDLTKWVSDERRESIHQSQVSEFQFFEYIFARRFELLMALNRPLAALKEVLEFLQQMSQKIENFSAQFPTPEQATVFKYIWSFSVGYSILKHPTLRPFVHKAPEQLTRESSKTFSLLGDILYYVRSRMDAFLELANPERFSALVIQKNAPIDDESTEDESIPKISLNTEILKTPNLVDSLSDRKTFDEVYLQVSLVSQHFFKLSEYRPRSVTRLTYDMATLHFTQKQYKQASKFLKVISIEDGWNRIATHVRIQLAECEQYLQHPEIFVTACLGLLGPESGSDEIRAKYQKQLVDVAVSGLSTVLMRDLYPLIDCKLKPIVKENYFVGDTLTVDCILESNLISPISFSKLSLTMTDSSSDSFMHASDTISFTLRKISVNPGRNLFQLSTELPSKANFIFDKIRLEIGKLVLSQQLRSSYEPIAVDNSKATLELEVAQPDSPLIGQIQSIQLILITNEDTIKRGVVSVSSSSGLQILDHSDGIIQITASDGTIRKEPLDFVKASFTMPPCNTHEVAELFFPVIAPADAENVHELSITISYEKDTKETFDIVALVEIPFDEAISFSHRIITTQNSMYLQVKGKNKTVGPITLLQNSLEPPKGYKILEECIPSSGVEATLLYPKCEASFVFPMILASSDISEDHTTHYKFELLFSSPSETFANFLPENFKVAYNFSISKPRVDYEICFSAAPTAFVGELFPFSFSVVKKQPNTSEITFSIEGNNQWLIIGNSQSKLNLVPGKATIIHVQLISIVTGWVTLPKVTLQGIDSENVSYQPHSDKVKISPKGEFDCRCVPRD